MRDSIRLLRRALPLVSVAVIAAVAYDGWIFYSRWSSARETGQAGQAEGARLPRQTLDLIGGTDFRIIDFYASPQVIRRGNQARICFGVYGAKRVRIEPAVGDLRPAASYCLQVDDAAAVPEDRRAAHQAGALAIGGLLDDGVDDTAAADPAAPHQDEAPQGRHPAAHVERDGPANAHPDLRDLVAFDLARRSGARLERHGVQRAPDPEDVRLGLLSPELEGDELARAKRLVVQPEHPRREGPGLVGPVPGRRPDLAPLHKQLIIESHGDCALRSDGARHGRGLLGPRLDGLHSAALSAGKELDGVPDRYAPGLHKPGDDPARVEAVDILDREPQGPAGRRRVGAEALQRIEQRRSAVPRHPVAALDQPLPVLRGDGDEVRGLHP